MYSSMSLAALKAELGKRNASFTGKKAELVARLEAYDKNIRVHDEGTVEYIKIEDSMIVPADNLYEDINSSTELPHFTRLHIQSFAERYSQRIKKAMQMYEYRHLVTAQVAKYGSYTFFRGQCRDSMKKSYIVDIKICSTDDDCTIKETHCECAVESGPEAHCKHVLILMLGIESMVRNKCIVLYEICTQQLEMGKRPKPFDAFPMLRQKYKRKKHNINFDPIKEEDIPESYNDYVKNLIVNFGPTTAPIRQIIPLANINALKRDHTYD